MPVTDATPSKGGFLPSDVWARNVEGWKPDSKKEADNNFTLFALTVCFAAFAVTSWQWLIPAVQTADNVLLDQLRAIQQRNMLLTAHLRHLDDAHQSHLQSRRLMSAVGQLADEERWTALHYTTQQLLADNEPMEDPAENMAAEEVPEQAASVPLKDTNETSTADIIGSSSRRLLDTGSAMLEGLQQLSLNTGRSLLGSLRGSPSPPKPVSQTRDSTHRYHNARVASNAAWKKKRQKRGQQQRKNQKNGRAQARHFKNNKNKRR